MGVAPLSLTAAASIGLLGWSNTVNCVSLIFAFFLHLASYAKLRFGLISAATLSV